MGLGVNGLTMSRVVNISIILLKLLNIVMLKTFHVYYDRFNLKNRK